LASALPVVAGCCCPLAGLVACTPNYINPLAGPANPLPPLDKCIADRHLWVPVGPPAATLSVSIIEPKGGLPPRGTVLVLHGIFTRAITMLPQARALAYTGYRAVLVDLRGHGRSTGKYLTYGVGEARDISQVIDALDKQQLIAGQIGVLGLSYGATTAIHLAACDPRVQAVVAVEPFGMVRPEIRRFSYMIAPEVSCFLSDAHFLRIVDRAGAMAGFDPDRSDAVDAIARTSAPVLLLHGTDDWITPDWNSVVLQEAAPDYAELIPIPGGGHVSLWFDLDGSVSAHTIEWFNRWLGGCPGAPIHNGALADDLSQNLLTRTARREECARGGFSR
jgi:pimeloyl-ACP methyl ester carboxylesterase